MHALVIEDRLEIAASIADELRELGWSSYDVVDGEEDAVRTAICRPPDLIIADERLREGSGKAAVSAICSKRKIASVFIVADPIVMTPDLSHAVVLAKPFGLRDLTGAIEEAMTRVGRHGPNAATIPHDQPSGRQPG
jgi:DNA-binding response OmpR family regulator